MTKTVEAIYENGVLKPMTLLNIPEHKKVNLIIEDEIPKTPDILSLASEVYNGFSLAEIEDIEKIVLNRNHFSRV